MNAIVVKNILSEDILLRDNAKFIVEQAEKTNDFVLDFSGVNFISRSFADELYSYMEKEERIKIINGNDVVKNMMQAVKISHTKKRVFFSDIPVSKLNSEEEMREYFHSVR
jgi:anti-anti-sigma regulatory factor